MAIKIPAQPGPVPPPGRKRGRPPANSAHDTGNPRFVRVQTAKLIQEVLYVAATGLLDGHPMVSVRSQLIADLSILPVDGSMHATEVASFHASYRRVRPHLQAIEQYGPQKWADRETGKLLGHGAHWYRDAVIRSPWPPGKRRKYQPLSKLQSQMRRRPAAFDAFTSHERLFLRLPAVAQSAISKVVRAALGQEARSGAVPHGYKIGPLTDYFSRPAAERALFVDPQLTAIVTAAIRSMPTARRHRVNSIRGGRARPLRKGGKLYVTPVPPLGLPRRRPFKPRR